MTLPANHPQNIPLKEWSDGWLKLQVASHLGQTYLLLHDAEKRLNDFPVTKEEMVQFLITKNDIPLAGSGY